MDNLNNKITNLLIELNNNYKSIEKMKKEKNDLYQKLNNKIEEFEKERNNNKKRENYIINYFEKINADIIKKMDNDINKKIEELKNEVMNYINI